MSELHGVRKLAIFHVRVTRSESQSCADLVHGRTPLLDHVLD